MDVVCEDCGESNRSGTEFCLFCGAYLPWAAAATAAGPTGETAAGPDSSTVVLPPVTPAAPAEQRPGRERGETELPRPGAPTAGSPAAAGAGDRGVGSTMVRETACPQCGRPNGPDRYFCSRCGLQLIPSPAAQRLPVTRRREPSWWNRFLDDRDRLARRAYRQSLPAAYRWRRVVVGALVVALLAAFGVVSRGHPLVWARSRVDDLRGTLVLVPQVQASAEPAEATLAPSTPGSLLDRTSQAWTIPWTADTPGSTCPAASSTATVVLTFSPARRVRALEVYAGLSETLPESALEFRPTKLAVDYGSDRCLEVDLPEPYENEELEADSEKPVTSVRISVMAVHAPPAGSTDRLSISEIGVLARPLRLPARP